MKLRTGCLLALLLVVLVAGGVVVHDFLTKQADVTVTATHLYGDPLLAEGVTMSQSHVLDDKLYWDVDYNIWGETQVESAYHLYQNSGERVYDAPLELQIYCPINLSMGVGGGDIFEDYDDREMYPDMMNYPLLPAKDVASRTAAGETATESVYLQDYYKTYPLQIDFNGYRFGYVHEGAIREVFEAMQNYVAIPVPDDHLIEVTVTKDVSGTATDVSMNTLSGGCEVWADSWLNVGSDIYFTVDVDNLDGEADDETANRFPLTQQIHRLTVKFAETEGAADGQISGVERLGSVYTLPQNTHVQAMEQREGTDEILLLLEESGQLILRVMDKDFRQIQMLKLGTVPEESWGFRMIQGENFLCALENGGKFYLMTPQGEGYAPVLEGDYTNHLALDEKEEWNYLRGENTILYQDGMMMMAFAPATWDTNEVTYLTLFDEEGCQYVGTFHLSLAEDSAIGRGWSQMTRRQDENPIGLRLK